MNRYKLNLNFLLFLIFDFLLLTSCSVTKQISRSAQQLVIKDSSLLAAHIGISIYEPASNKYWYNYQGDKYFVPASNTKLPTCYAAMKYLGDSLVGLRYEKQNNNIRVLGTGDPTFLHKDFKNQRVFDFLSANQSTLVFACNTTWQAKKFGDGWAWNDYDASYMPERSPMPIFGNVFTLNFNERDSLVIFPNFKDEVLQFPIWLATAKGDSAIKRTKSALSEKFSIRRVQEMNAFEIVKSNSRFTQQEIPIHNAERFTAAYLAGLFSNSGLYSCDYENYDLNRQKKLSIIHSQPTDSLLKITMHRSDNFFAEQTLLMVSNERLGVMNDEKIIDTLLKTDLKDLPQKPRWVDGSGLSRYDLFTPQDFVAILNKIKTEFGMERIKVILPTGNTGTLANYYKAENGYLFAKTGTLSGVVALSGYLYTKKNKLLIFSVLVNNHQASATAVRKAVEKFIEGIRNRY